MLKIHWKEVKDPLETPSGEIISELIGSRSGEGYDLGHSLARIVIPPGGSSSAHYHQVSEESYFILEGRAWMMLDGQEFLLESGEVCYITPGKVHQIKNQDERDLVFLAVCVPAWVPEDSFED